MVYTGTLFIGDNGAFLCIPMKIGVKFEHSKLVDYRPFQTLGAPNWLELGASLPADRVPQERRKALAPAVLCQLRLPHLRTSLRTPLLL
jgi:hypothetical protein